MSLSILTISSALLLSVPSPGAEMPSAFLLEGNLNEGSRIEQLKGNLIPRPRLPWPTSPFPIEG
jgi:hypothetical protein